MKKPLTVYKASAGSGKTFTLATEYISLIVENPQQYRNILAVTFTNKATEEMKTRILSQLYGIWKTLPESEPYLKAVEQKTGLKPALISERAGMGLANLLHNYNYFRVETIDTFFQSVLRNMARELDLTTNLRIGLNDIQVEEMAVDQIIEDLNVQDVMLKWIMKYIMENISDDKTWNVIGQIKKFGRTIFRDEYKSVSTALDRKMKEPAFFDDYTASLRDLRRQAAERMGDLANQFFDVLEEEQLTIDDFAYGKTGVCGFFLKLRQGIFDESIVGKRVADSVGDPVKWYKKTHPRRELIHTLADGTLGSLLRRAVEERPHQWKLYKSADLTLRHLNQLRLLSSIEQKVHELNEDANRFLLSDTQQLLHTLIDGSDSPFIFEKIGTQLEHVMIDEFQDTSTIQWQNFKVLLEEAMSHEGSSNLIVGDVKQSIYRWRSGDWHLLNDIERQFHSQQIETLNLGTNYRSQRHVIAFNNTFFAQAAQLEYLRLKETNETEAEQLSKAYADVEQEIPTNRKDEGYVNIRLLPPEDYQQEVFRQLADTIGNLTARGVAHHDMAILVRFNRDIPQIARYFMEHMPTVTIVSDEAFRLDASNAVCILIHALQLLVHPDDMLTKAAIVKSYQCDVKKAYSEDHDLLLSTTDLDALLPQDYIRQFDALRAMPLYDLVERLYTLFDLQLLNDQSAYVCAFYDHLSAYVNENATDISHFLDEWNDTLCAKTIQSDETHGVRIFSIHKSKGLEYDHVIIPFCDWQMEKQTGNVIWCQPSEAPFNELPIAPIDYNQKQMKGTIYEEDYLHEHLQNTVDNLNLLYVAFTRAKRSLYVIGRRHAGSSRSGLIEQSLPMVAAALTGSTLEGVDDEGEPISFSYGEEIAEPQPDDGKLKSEPSRNPFLQIASPLHVSIRNFNNKVTFLQSNQSRHFVESEEQESQERQSYIQTGSILHEIFSTIKTTEDIPAALERLQFEGVLYDDRITADRITSLLRKRLSHPQVADWFSPRWKLFNECTILSVRDGQLQERRPDRVMTDGQQWIVVDFKFGSPKPGYTAQVQEYMSLIASMSHQPVRGYLWFVYSNQIEEVTLSTKNEDHHG